MSKAGEVVLTRFRKKGNLSLELREIEDVVSRLKHHHEGAYSWLVAYCHGTYNTITPNMKKLLTNPLYPLVEGDRLKEGVCEYILSHPS